MIGTDFCKRAVYLFCSSFKFDRRLENLEEFKALDEEKSLKILYL